MGPVPQFAAESRGTWRPRGAAAHRPGPQLNASGRRCGSDWLRNLAAWRPRMLPDPDNDPDSATWLFLDPTARGRIRKDSQINQCCDAVINGLDMLVLNLPYCPKFSIKKRPIDDPCQIQFHLWLWLICCCIDASHPSPSRHSLSNGGKQPSPRRMGMKKTRHFLLSSFLRQHCAASSIRDRFLDVGSRGTQSQCCVSKSKPGLAGRPGSRAYSHPTLLCTLSSVQANLSNHDWKLGCMGEVVLEERLVRGRRHGHARRRTAT